MAPPRRKVAARGKKQIYEENAATLRFYRAVVLAASAICHVNLFLFYSYSYVWTWLLASLTTTVSLCSLRYMGSMAEATRHPDSGALLFEGADLNAQDQGTGVAVYLKDVILLTAILQVASVVWCNVWWFWLLIPLRAGYLMWRALRMWMGC